MLFISAHFELMWLAKHSLNPYVFNMLLLRIILRPLFLTLTMIQLHTALFFFLLLPILASCDDEKVYIVYFGEHKGDKELQEIEDTHHSYLLSVKKSEEDAKSSLLYSYKYSINGFAAVLSPDEASKLSGLEEVVSVYESNPGKYRLHTTRSWEFSGLPEIEAESTLKKEDLLLKSNYGNNVIIGVLDSGLWPESQSFRDDGLGDIPKAWKGTCQSGDSFNSSNCNKKLIGAKYYIKGYEKYYGPLNRTLDYKSPRDMDGHGTHTSSTAAGRRVENISAIGGFAPGTASGGAPLALLAMYKVCWAVPGHGKEEGNTCFDEDMLAAMDDAIRDGVDVISISIGMTRPTPYNQDSIAIGALHAIKRNIVVSCSAGNSGPSPATLSNTAPWIITVGASSLDRMFVAPLLLGNGKKFMGQTVTPYKLENKMYPLVFAGQVVKSNVSKDLVGQCMPKSLSPEKTKGNIVVCLRGNGTRVGKGGEVKRAGGVGYILANSKANGAEISTDAHLLPATAVGYKDGLKILKYIQSTKEPKAYIFPAQTVLHTKPAPFMAAFTSRGPSSIAPSILKPDITAPGLNILAAWSEESSPTKLDIDQRVVKYNIESGTSMSCPHVSGAAALLKAIHPHWSSAAIRSALITSAGLKNNMGKQITDASGLPADPFQFGAGHFRPAKAADPGLIYNASYSDYLLFLCAIGVKGISPSSKCPKHASSPSSLNYPSIALPKLNGTAVVKRVVTNVGSSASLYSASVTPPLGFSIKISPPILYFNRTGETKRFSVIVKAHHDMKMNMVKEEYRFGWLTWSDAVHVVRSPIAVSLA